MAVDGGVGKAMGGNVSFSSGPQSGLDCAKIGRHQLSFPHPHEASISLLQISPFLQGHSSIELCERASVACRRLISWVLGLELVY